MKRVLRQVAEGISFLELLLDETICEGDILIHGHTHVLKAEQMEGYILLNPGSVSIPKEGNPPTYAVLEDKTFTIKDFDGNIIKEMRLG